jgi:hypothetical protein
MSRPWVNPSVGQKIAVNLSNYDLCKTHRLAEEDELVKGVWAILNWISNEVKHNPGAWK